MFEVGKTRINSSRMTDIGLADAFQETFSLLLGFELYPPTDVEVLSFNSRECDLIWK